MLNMTREADTNRIRNIALQDDDEMKIIYTKIQRTVNHQCTLIIFVQSSVQIKHQLRTRWDCVITVRLSEQWSTASVGLSTIYSPLYRSLYGPPWFPSSLGSGWQAPKIDVGATVMLVFGFVSPISAIKHRSSFLNFHLGSWAGPPGFAAQPLYA